MAQPSTLFDDAERRIKSGVPVERVRAEALGVYISLCNQKKGISLEAAIRQLKLLWDTFA